VAQCLTDSVGNLVDLKSQGIPSSQGLFSILSCTYAEDLCSGSFSPTGKSDSKPIEALAASIDKELFTSVGPAEDSAEHRALEKEMIRCLENFRTYVVGRMDLSYAVTLLARYSSTPDRCNYLALKRLCNYLRRTIDW
jgi:hypothetical protein